MSTFVRPSGLERENKRILSNSIIFKQHFYFYDKIPAFTKITLQPFLSRIGDAITCLHSKTV